MAALFAVMAVLVSFCVPGDAFGSNRLSTGADASVTFSIPSPSEEFYVYDEAGAISSDDKQFIVDWGEYLNTNYGAQPVVTVVNSASADIIDIETYTDQMMRAWKVGGSSGYGILLVMDISADDYYCVSGDALKSHYTSSYLQTVLDEQVESAFASKDYSTAAKNFINTIANDLNTYMSENNLSGLTASDGTQTTAADDSAVSVSAPSSSKSTGSSLLKILLIVVLVLVILFCAIFIAVYMHGQKIKKQREEQRRRRDAMARRTMQQRTGDEYTGRPSQVQSRPVQQRPAQRRPSSAGARQTVRPSAARTGAAAARPQQRRTQQTEDVYSRSRSDSYRDFINNYNKRQ